MNPFEQFNDDPMQMVNDLKAFLARCDVNAPEVGGEGQIDLARTSDLKNKEGVEDEEGGPDPVPNPFAPTLH